MSVSPAPASSIPATPPMSAPPGSSNVVEDCFKGGDGEGYVSVFRRTGGILSGDQKRCKEYMDEHEALVWKSQLAAHEERIDTWRSDDLETARQKAAGTCPTERRKAASLMASQTPSSQLNFRILGARLS